jgi:alpha-tubulin suppressor-like RCC1 family protein
LLLQENGGDFDAAGIVKCWGANESGQLGNGSTLLGDEAEARPVVVRKPPSDVNKVDPRFMTTGLCAGKSFTCADVVFDDGAGVTCWGNNEQGQLGLGVLPSQSSPRAFNAATSLVTKKSDLGQRDLSLVPFLGLDHVTCGADFACALDREGAAWCWGANDVGQLGIGEVTSTPWPSAQAVDRGRNDAPPVFVAISAGERHVCGVDEEGMLWCWGGGARGQLGSASLMASPAPRSLGLRATTYALGRDFTIVRGPDQSEPLAFGQNFFGQLATGTSVASTIPVVSSAAGQQVSLLFGGSTAAHGCALRAGSLVCWGANSRGQLGDNSNEDRYVPVVALEAGTVDVFGGVGSVALGRSHTCAVDASGGLWCWGGNERKQLGASVKEPTSTKPVQALAALSKMR